MPNHSYIEIVGNGDKRRGGLVFAAPNYVLGRAVAMLGILRDNKLCWAFSFEKNMQQMMTLKELCVANKQNYAE